MVYPLLWCRDWQFNALLVGCTPTSGHDRHMYVCMTHTLEYMTSPLQGARVYVKLTLNTTIIRQRVQAAVQSNIICK